MVAQRLDGTAIAKSIRERIGAEIVEKQKLNPRYRPCLKIIQGASVLFLPPGTPADRILLSIVGDRSDSCLSRLPRPASR